MTQKKLYEYYEDFGRMGSLSGRMLLTDAERDELEGASGYAYDVLGKHSEIEITLDDETLRLVTDDQIFLERAQTLGVSLESGFDPREYLPEEDDLEEEECEEDDE